MTQRVLHIVGRMDRAGAETMVMNLYREIDRTKFQFDFVYFTAAVCDYDAEIEALGGRIHRIRQRNPISRFFALRRLLRNGSWSIVHAHTLFSSGLHLAAARLAGIPHRVAHSHSTQDANSTSRAGRLYQRLMRLLLVWAPTAYVACGAAAAAYLFPGRRDVVVITNAIDIDRFANASGSHIRAQLGVLGECLLILQVGRYMPVKNHAFSAQIALALREAGVDFRMLFVGTGPEQAAIEALVNANGLQDQVLLLGLREDIPELMAAADVMLMPSLHEGFPVVLVESQAAGLPAVISSVISSEVDLGLRLVESVGLEEPLGQWADRIRRVASMIVPEASIRRTTIAKRGFSPASGVRLLEAVYGA